MGVEGLAAEAMAVADSGAAARVEVGWVEAG